MAVAIPTGGVQRWPSPSLLGVQQRWPSPSLLGVQQRWPSPSLLGGGVTNGWEAVSALGVSADGQVNHSGGGYGGVDWGGRNGK